MQRRVGRGNAGPWIERLARAGFATKGIVYGIIGVLALMAAFGQGGQLGGSQSAIRTIGSQPFGTALLILAGIGLAGYALWRFIQGGLDPEHEGSDGKGIAKRIGFVGSGLMHAALAIAAFQLATGAGGGGSQQTYLAQMMDSTFGRVVIGLVGLGIIGAGLYQLYKAYTAKFQRVLRTGEMSAAERKWSVRLGRIGLAARGVVFPIIGYFVLRAAIEYSPGTARDIGGALATLGAQAYGTILLIVVSAGLVAYGAYQLVMARYRRFPAHG